MTTRLNLLPWREMRRRDLDQKLLRLAIGAWALTALIVGAAYLHVGDLIVVQNQRNDFLKLEIAKVEKEIKEIAELKKKRQDLIARMNVIQQLQADRTRVVHIFDELVRRVPEGVQLRTLKQTGNVIALTGAAQSNARVSALMRNFSGSEWFADPELEVINVKPQGGDRVSEFSMKVKNITKKEAAEVSGSGT
ncbi:MAG: PilN domain-containing protein [Gammaproteobacteria bacterium]|nr:PilN domain-containing protein [Gammaproteobacteria bacterium]